VHHLISGRFLAKTICGTGIRRLTLGHAIEADQPPPNLRTRGQASSPERSPCRHKARRKTIRSVFGEVPGAEQHLEDGYGLVVDLDLSPGLDGRPVSR